MLDHLLDVYPLEGCGLLAGPGDYADHVYCVSNIINSSIAYEMDPKEQLEAMLDIESRGWEILAIFHSHPAGPERPSARDAAVITYPESAYVIVSLSRIDEPSVRAFTMTDGVTREIPLTVV